MRGRFKRRRPGVLHVQNGREVRSSRSALLAAVCVTVEFELRLRKGRRGRHSRKTYASPRSGQENLFFASSERKRGQEAHGAPFQQLFVSPSESNYIYEKAAKGVILAKRTLVCGYSTVRVI